MRAGRQAVRGPGTAGAAARSGRFRRRPRGPDPGRALQELAHPAGLELHDGAAARPRRPEVFWPRGKLLGGSSSINAMIYIRGARGDYDEWAELTGNPAWSYDHVLPLFRRMEDNARGADRFHGVGGPLRVEDLRSPHPWTAPSSRPRWRPAIRATTTSTAPRRR